MLLIGALFAGAAVWLTASTQASHWVWKSWDRMFGPSATANAIPGALAQPESSGTSGYTIIAIDEPSAGTSTLEGTIVFGVNASGAMTGAYSDQVDVGHGFVCATGGTSCTSFDAPNAGSSPPSGWFQGTVGIGIDTAGDVVGVYIDSNNAYHGFVREVSTGTITDFDDPNAPTATPSRGTFPSGINDNGQIVGNYTTGSYDTLSLYHGFLYSIANGTFTEIDEPNAGTENAASYQKEGTIPVAINASGVVTGYYVDSSGKRHGFIYSAGSYASIDAPGATTNTGKGGGFTGTLPFGIDSAGDVVGSYTDSSGVRHGFILPAGSTTPTSFDAPGANTTSQSVNFGGTFPTSIDPTGTYVTGIYTDSSGLGHGFVYYLPLTSSGSFTTFTAPNQTTSTSGLPIQGGVFGVNASGTVAGFYVDSNEVLHGFEYVPTATPTPTFSPGQGTYSAEQSVTISDTDSAATIYYTTNGSTPTVNSTKYTDPIAVSSTETINAIALDSSSGGYIESAVASATYTITVSTPTQAATPTFSPAAGAYTSAQSVTISDATAGATIYYTTNGTAPTTGSTVYSGPITVSSSETIEAIATASGYSTSAVAPAAYTINSSASSTGEWTWIGGSNMAKQPGVYGALGVPSAGNIPGSRAEAVNWTDRSGNLWLFGGYGHDANGDLGYLNDLWEFSPSTNEWTWMGGSGTIPSGSGQPGVYGTLGTPAAGNIPGGRQEAVSWADNSGHLWLFGGQGLDSSDTTGTLNDLWEFNPSTDEWAWMGGSSTVGSNGGQPGVYGTLGTPAAGNISGGRYEASSWTDSSGNFWLFGGAGYDANDTVGRLHDLWEFNPSTNQWAWMGGNSTVGTQSSDYGVFGTLGTPAEENIPGWRFDASSWTDSNGHLWLFAGQGCTAIGCYNFINDLWELSPSTNPQQWAWMGGSSGNGFQDGEYGSLGMPASGNFPGSRQSASSWTDSTGNLWLFGGDGLDANGDAGNLNDLWELNPSTNPVQWVWMGGSSTIASGSGQPGVYGALGTPAAGNVPGGRQSASSWTDIRGNLWLFGGNGFDSNDTLGYLNDLWEFQLPAAATPVFSVAPGTYPTAQTVTISDATAGATIYYTANGTRPTTSSGVYSGSITVSSTETLEAIAVASGDSISAVASAAYTIAPPAATPTFSPAAGTYTSAQSVTISDTTPGTTIYYTTNGTTPTSSSTVYSSSSPIEVSSSETIEAIAAATGYSNSAAATAAYVINIPGFGPPSGSQPGSISIQPGASTGNTATISVVGTNGFSGTVNLSCSIAPIAANDPPTCSLSPSSVTLSGTTAQTSTLTVSTTAATSALTRPAWRRVGGTALAVILMLVIPRRRRNWLAMLVSLAIIALVGVAGCGGGSGGGGGGGNTGTTAGTYTITVTGTSGTTSATVATVTLTVE